MPTDSQIFMREVRKIFPNATKKKVFRRLPSDNFCWDYGEVSVRNYPKRYHKTIRRINRMAKHYSRKKGFSLKSMMKKKRR